MYLIDTSVWVDFLRGKETPKVRFLEALLEEGEAYLCEITYTEICQGAKTRRQFDKYSEYFSRLPFLPLAPEWHKEAARLGFETRAQGFQPFIADLVISLTALSHKATLVTEDKDFNVYRELFGLALA